MWRSGEKELVILRPGESKNAKKGESDLSEFITLCKLLLNQTLEMALHEQPEVVGFKTTVEIAIMEDNLGNTDVHSGKKAEFFIPL